MTFRNLKTLKPVTRDSAAVFHFHELEFESPDGAVDDAGEPVMLVPWIEVRPVGDMNPSYLNAVLQAQSGKRKFDKLDVKTLRQNREQDRELYPRHVFTGRWGNWIDDATGEQVPYSEEKAVELMAALPADQVDQLRAFCNSLDNFR